MKRVPPARQFIARLCASLIGMTLVSMGTVRSQVTPTPSKLFSMGTAQVSLPPGISVTKRQGPDFELFYFTRITNGKKRQILFAYNGFAPTFPNELPKRTPVTRTTINGSPARIVTGKNKAGKVTRETLVIITEQQQYHFVSSGLSDTDTKIADTIIRSLRRKADKISPPPTAVRKAFQLSSFYKKWVSVNGLPVVGSEKVSDAAMEEATYLTNRLLTGQDAVCQALVRARVRIAIMAPTEQTTDLPEHSDLTPKDYWNRRARGLGATPDRPAISCAEENLLNLPGDRYRGENIFIHEFAHTIHLMGLNQTNPAFDVTLKTAYKDAMAQNRWRGTYAATNHEEYFAEGVQSYFDCNAHDNASHGPIDTREKLKTYDPVLFALIDQTFHHSVWRYTRPETRTTRKTL